MAIIKIDTKTTVGKIKPMHAVGQPPLGGLGKKYFQHFHYLSEIGTPYSRLHDVGGSFGECLFVDIPNIFRNFDADVNDPASYDFTFTDALIGALLEAGVEPYYRLGITIENQADIKAYHTAPPKDFDKWAAICEHIVSHYIDGWADGFFYPMTYFEIWNEPDDGMRPNGEASQMWSGTPSEYYRLYAVTAKRLKGRFGDRIKVGGYGAISLAAGPFPEEVKTDPRKQYYIDFFYGFLDYIKETGAPLDFFSWHSYYPTRHTLPIVPFLRGVLDKYGFKGAEIHLNEWNPRHEERGTARHSAEITAMMLGMQNLPIELLMLYDARMPGDSYAALFHPMTYRPMQGYYALAAFNRLYRLKNQVSLECDVDQLYAVAASDGKQSALVISNLTGATQPLSIEGADLSDARWYVIDNSRLLSWSAPIREIENNAVVLVEF